MEKVVILCAGSPGKSIPIHKIIGDAEVVVVDSDDYTKAEIPSPGDRRFDVTFEIRNHRDESGQYHLAKQQNPYHNGGLRKKTKGGFKRF